MSTPTQTPTPILAITTIVLITGATQGLGLQLARTLSTPTLHPNYHIIIGALTASLGESALSQLLAEDASRSLSTIQIDVTSDPSISDAVELIQQKYGRLDVLYNNAGVLLDKLNQASLTREIFERTYQVNVFGAAAVTEALIPLLEKSTSTCPRIVFMSSRLGSLETKAEQMEKQKAGKASGKRLFPVYRSSKCAVNMLMLHYAGLFAKWGWKVNACDPGLCDTEMTRETYGDDVVKGSVEDGVRNAVRLATLGVEGETGTFSNWEGVVGW